MDSLSRTYVNLSFQAILAKEIKGQDRKQSLGSTSNPRLNKKSTKMLQIGQ
jgi:hypothetical protein